MFSGFDCFNINESEFQQSIDPYRNIVLGRSQDFIRIDDDAREERGVDEQ